jgi:hypothetical protein
MGARAGSARATVFRVLAAVFALAAVQHLARALGVGGDGSRNRHLVFVAINALVAAGLWLRPPFFAWAFLALAVQQLASHGGAAVRAWTTERRIDWLSLAVVAVVLTTAALLLQDRRPAGRRERIGRV